VTVRALMIFESRVAIEAAADDLARGGDGAADSNLAMAI
jgi:hypothetical protein